MLTVAGADFAFARHSSSLVCADILHRIATVKHCRIWSPGAGRPLRPSKVAREAAEDALRCGADSLGADGHYRETVREATNALGVGLRNAPATSDEIAASYMLVRILLAEQRLKIPARFDQLLDQLRATQVRYLDGGRIKIVHPETTGEDSRITHGDAVAALVVAIWLGRAELGGLTGGLTAAGLRRFATDGPMLDDDPYPETDSWDDAPDTGLVWHG